MFENIVDLHIHSFYSDGSMSPEDIYNTAKAKGVGLIAITDHNVLEGSLELQKLCEKSNIKCLSGVEIDCLDHGLYVHILGYGMNLMDKEFIGFIKSNRNLLDYISVKLIEKMEKDYPFISLADFDTFYYDKRKGGWKALHYFMSKGLIDNLKEGMEFYTKYNCSYHSVDFPSVSSVSEYIHKAGGKAILAHPGVVIKETDMKIFSNVVQRLIDQGLDGIECFYPYHTDEITEACLRICRERNLLITSGSDCHGEFGNTNIGDMNIMLSKLNLENI